MEKEEKKKGQKCWQVEAKKKKGDLCVIYDRCKGCGFCIEFCPVDALEPSSNTTDKGYYPPTMKGGCILCGKCEKMCPEFAIYVKEEKE